MTMFLFFFSKINWLAASWLSLYFLLLLWSHSVKSKRATNEITVTLVQSTKLNWMEQLEPKPTLCRRWCQMRYAAYGPQTDPICVYVESAREMASVCVLSWRPENHSRTLPDPPPPDPTKKWKEDVYTVHCCCCCVGYGVYSVWSVVHELSDAERDWMKDYDYEEAIRGRCGPPDWGMGGGGIPEEPIPQWCWHRFTETRSFFIFKHTRAPHQATHISSACCLWRCGWRWYPPSIYLSFYSAIHAIQHSWCYYVWQELSGRREAALAMTQKIRYIFRYNGIFV